MKRVAPCIKADLHVHSTVSDGRASPKEIVLAAVSEGINVLAITDHDSFKGAYLATRYAEQLELLVVIGAEISLPQGDVLVLCSSLPVQKPYNSIEEFIEIYREQDCLVVPAHPFDTWRNSMNGLVYRYSWDAIEVFNGAACYSANREAMKVAEELALAGIGNSDAHRIEELGRVYTIIKGLEECSVDDVLAGIRRGDVAIRVTEKYTEPPHCRFSSSLFSVGSRGEPVVRRSSVDENYLG